MKKFLIKSGILMAVVLLVHVLLAQMANGFTDPYYSKLSSDKQKSLVLGGSRASEGVIPTVFDSVMTQNGRSSGMFNFAFTNSDSPYGPVYLNAIKEKIADGTTDGIFILSVHPWNISSLSDDPDDLEAFRENNMALAKIGHYSGTPNYDYLMNAYGYGWGNILLKDVESSLFEYFSNKGMFKGGQWSYVHKDGWLEVKSMLTDTTEIIAEMNKKIESWKKREINNSYVFSKKRLDYLKETIVALQKHGTVYLVRFPVHREIVTFEQNVMPNFDALMSDLSAHHHIEYFNFANASEDYYYSDGHHFLKGSAEKFSVDLANKILNKGQKSDQ